MKRMKWYAALSSCLFVFGAGLICPVPALSAANPLDTWTPVTTLPSPGSQESTDIAHLLYGDGLFMVLRHSGFDHASWINIKTPYSSRNLTEWTKANTGFFDVAYGNNIFMGVIPVGGLGAFEPGNDYAGSIHTSVDGQTWEKRYETQISDTVSYTPEGGFDKVVFRDGLFMVHLVSRYRQAIWTSADGMEWQKDGGGTYNPNDIASGNGRHVYVENDTAFSSTDKVNWTSMKVGKDLGLAGVAFGNGTFAAVGRKGKIYLSPDGIFWKAKETATVQDLNAIIYVDDRFYIAGNGGAFFHSGPLFTYSLEVGTLGMGKGGVQSYPAGIDCGNACFQHYDAITYVTLTATPEEGSSFAGWSGACNGKSPTCLVPVESVRYAIAHFDSDDPLDNSWTPKEVPTAENLRGVAGGNGALVAVGDNGAIVVSTDGGATWVDRKVSLYYGLTGVTYGNQMFLAIGPDGTKATSPDGLTWAVASPAEYQPQKAVVFGNGTFVVAGGIGGSETAVFETSQDGQSWTETSVPAADVKSVTYGGGSFAAVGKDFVMISSDGVTWTTQQLQAENCSSTSLESITYGNSLFVAVGYGYVSGDNYPGIIFTSPDGVVWTQRSSGVDMPLTHVSYGGGTFLAFGEGRVILGSGKGGLVIGSKDGISWEAKLPLEGPPLAGATFADGAFTAVGEGGTVLQCSVLKGDLNMNGKVDLTDFVMGVQILSGGKPPQPVNRNAEVSKDGRIGLQELLFILQKTARIR